MTDPVPTHPHVKETGEFRLPGDLSRRDLVHRMIRVDHAGEFGAVRIYEGQLDVLGGDPEAAAVREMAEKELEHLRAFEQMMVARHVRPTLLSPLWHVVGYAVGAATALLGAKAAMAATEAVEDVIEEHYAGQASELGDDEADLRRTIETFRMDEIGHRDTAVARGAHEAPAYPFLTAAIKAGSRLAVWLSERV
ncbi:MAG: demethoxyubiquinone hydroxylase family protein [Alphaproteobacteria bacterium]